MAQIDRIFLKYPFFGFRKMCDYLNNTLSYSVGEKRVRWLINLMGLVPIYQTPRTTIPDPDHQKFLYLHQGVRIEHCNQVWSSDITSIPIKNGFCILLPLWTGIAKKFYSGSTPTAWIRTFAWQQWRKHWQDMGARTSSTLTREVSLQVQTLQAFCKGMGSVFPVLRRWLWKLRPENLRNGRPDEINHADKGHVVSVTTCPCPSGLEQSIHAFESGIAQ